MYKIDCSKDDTENPNVEDIKPTTTTTTEQIFDNESNQDSGSLLKVFDSVAKLLYNSLVSVRLSVSP